MYFYVQQAARYLRPIFAQWIQSAHGKTSYGFDVLLSPTSGPATSATHMLGTIIDLKHMSRYCKYLQNKHLSLKTLSKMLQVIHISTAHFVGSDSLAR